MNGEIGELTEDRHWKRCIKHFTMMNLCRSRGYLIVSTL